jgi:hypothetical protein
LLYHAGFVKLTCSVAPRTVSDQVLLEMGDTSR